ncbi:hypothetical protein ACFCW6_14910 [Streptomyces sp. NPDC056333]|uniref:hypothetical protein n=1 Tax=Streptomyces sp. NPDC056333 TaxID=3345786 RepID=UPI0035D55FA3
MGRHAATTNAPVTVSGVKSGLLGTRMLSVEASNVHHDPGHTSGRQVRGQPARWVI